MISPVSPIVINGVVFAASSGEYHPALGAAMTASERAQIVIALLGFTEQRAALLETPPFVFSMTCRNS
jgi:hypothetical protein